MCTDCVKVAIDVTIRTGTADVRARLLCLSHELYPGTSPGAIKTTGLLRELASQHDVTVVTAQRGGAVAGARCQVVRSWVPWRLFRVLERLRLGRFIQFFVWPDKSIFWFVPAFFWCRRELRRRQYDAICVFAMPYGSVFVGASLRRFSGLPLIVNLSDSPTCSGIHFRFQSALHRTLQLWLEDYFIKAADRVVYVSSTNLERVKARLTDEEKGKLRLCRRGADPEFGRVKDDPTHDAKRFTIVYAGGMRGWLEFYEPRGSFKWIRRAVRGLNEIGTVEISGIDIAPHSPIFLGRAVRLLLRKHPEWTGRVAVDVVGNQFVDRIVTSVLEREGLAEFMTVEPPIPHDAIAGRLAAADLLFLSLHGRSDGEPEGIISSKTYEYLLTDKPILAALPDGENRTFLSGHEGVWLVGPRDEEAMAGAIEVIAESRFAGKPLRFDRTANLHTMSYAARAREFAAIVEGVIEDLTHGK